MNLLDTSLTLAKLSVGAACRPAATLKATVELGRDVLGAGARTVALARGEEAEPAVALPTRDRRFADRAWTDSPWFFGIGQCYLAWARWLHQLADIGSAGATCPQDAQRATFAVDALIDAVAPTNFLATNPAAVRRAVETRGASVAQGVANFAEDLADNRGRPRQVDRAAFVVGRDLACTPGKIVFRNELMELIQYEPQTQTVHRVPLLLSPPWINKYYVMDLAPGRSFAEWAVQHGHTVFAISYRDPDESMRDVSLDDYLLDGLGEALDVVGEITGAETANVAGLCVGGTLAVMLLSYLAQHGDDRVRTLTLLNTLVDFSRPGPLGVFTDRTAVRRVERQMARHGYMPAEAMSSTFDALRANDLIWNYVASSWLMGEPAPAFDILAWNADATRISQATHGEYLKACYLDNRLAAGTMQLAGATLNPRDVTADTYILAAADDHITPWKSSYATTGLLAGPVRFVLSSAGHIAGIVNPPSTKRRHWTNDHPGGRTPEPDPENWLASATEHPGSWWDDWAAWIGERAGGRQAPPAMGALRHPIVGDAPGTYVHSNQRARRRAS